MAQKSVWAHSWHTDLISVPISSLSVYLTAHLHNSLSITIYKAHKDLACLLVFNCFYLLILRKSHCVGQANLTFGMFLHPSLWYWDHRCGHSSWLWKVTFDRKKERPVPSSVAWLFLFLKWVPVNMHSFLGLLRLSRSTQRSVHTQNANYSLSTHTNLLGGFIYLFFVFCFVCFLFFLRCPLLYQSWKTHL